MEDFSPSSQVCTDVLSCSPPEKIPAWLLGAGATLPPDWEHNLVQLKSCHDWCCQDVGALGFLSNPSSSLLKLPPAQCH